jgi:DNA-binding beta-propeller fold protein YncE
MHIRKTAVLLLAFGSALLSNLAAASSCDLRPHGGRADLALPLHPYMVAPLTRSCALLVTLSDDGDPAKGAVAVLKLKGGKLVVASVLDVPSEPVGMALTADESVVAIAGSSGIYFADVGKLLAGEAKAILGVSEYDKNAGTVSVLLSRDERVLFASDEQARFISVIDFAGARASQFTKITVLGRIPVDYAPTVLEMTADGKYVLVPVQGVNRKLKPPILCPGSPGGEPVNPIGAILSIKMEKAITWPTAVLPARSYAGCSPVRLGLTKDGRTAFVTNREENVLRVMDVAKIVSGDPNAVIAKVPVGPAPIGVALADHDRLALVSNSNRWSKEQTPQNLDLIDIAGPRRGKPVLLGKIPVGVFPRDITVWEHGRIVVVSNFGSNSLTLLDVTKLKTLASPQDSRSDGPLTTSHGDDLSGKGHASIGPTLRN